MPREPLPDDLRAQPFDRRRAREAGLPADRLRRRSLQRPFHGVFASTPPTTTVERCRAYEVRMKPGQFFSHTTALALYGLSMPEEFENETEVHVAAVLPADAPHARNVRGHRLQYALRPLQREGLPVAHPLDAFCHVAAQFGLEDLTIVADELLGLESLPEDQARGLLLAHIAAHRRVGAARLTRAARSARRGSRSPAETRVRLTLDAAGIPAAELNAAVEETGTGRYLGAPDFVWRAQRVLLEYEGDGHRVEKRQFRRDILRYDDFMADGWRVVRATGDDLTQAGRRDLVRRTRRALQLP